MKWIELRDVYTGGTIFLFGCHPTQSAYKVKHWLQEQKPDCLVFEDGRKVFRSRIVALNPV